MHDEVGIVAEGADGFGQKSEVAMPKELVGANREVGVEKNLQADSFGLRGSRKRSRR